MRVTSSGRWILLSLVAGCGAAGSFSLEIVFPDEASRQVTARIRVSAIVPASGASCADLLSGAAAPGDAGYPVEAQLEFAFPSGDAGALALKQEGEKLFYAEALDGSGVARYHGCTSGRAEGGAPRSVTVVLQRILRECYQDTDCVDDGQWCTGTPHCQNFVCLETPPDCDDQVACTVDSCNEELDRCDHLPDDDSCDDHDVCTGSETCDPVSGCRPGTPLSCDDGVFCNGVEGCDPVAGCVDEEDPDCDDGVPCTADSCDPVADECRHQPNAGGCPAFHIGPAPDTCPHRLPDDTQTTVCDFSGPSALLDASLAAPAEGARFILYDNLGASARFAGQVHVPGGSWIGAAPGIPPENVVLVSGRAVANGVLHLAGNNIHVDGLSIIALDGNENALSSWPTASSSSGATSGHLVERVIVFMIDQEVVGTNNFGPPLALGDDCTVRNSYFRGYLELRIQAKGRRNLRLLHNTFVQYQANNGGLLDATGSNGFVFANNVVLTLAQPEPVLIQADLAATNLVVSGNVSEGFGGLVTGYNPGDPFTKVQDNFVGEVELESPLVPRFLNDSTQRIAGPILGEGMSLDGVHIQGKVDVRPGAFQTPSARRLPRRLTLKVGRGTCGAEACDIDADAVAQEIQVAVWSSWPGGEIQVFPSASPYAGCAVIGRPLTLRGMGTAEDQVILQNGTEDALLAEFNVYDRHDATLVVLMNLQQPVTVRDLSLRLDTALSGDNFAVYTEDRVANIGRPLHRFERLKLSTTGAAAGANVGFYLGCRALVQDSLIWGGFQTCVRWGTRRVDSSATPASDAKVVNLSCRLVGTGSLAPKSFFDVAKATGAAIVNVAAESATPVPLLRAQRRSSGDTGAVALDPPVSFQVHAVSAKHVSTQFDGFTEASGSYTLNLVEMLDPSALLFAGPADSFLDPQSSALDSGVDPHNVDESLALGTSLNGVDRSGTSGVDRGCYEQ
ncbi:MAG: hypothetical protein GYA21_06820 [Myxococcales bacterium]|nr:hypothetical protein [Myxococcales bacterium]